MEAHNPSKSKTDYNLRGAMSCCFHSDQNTSWWYAVHLVQFSVLCCQTTFMAVIAIVIDCSYLHAFTSVLSHLYEESFAQYRTIQSSNGSWPHSRNILKHNIFGSIFGAVEF